MEGEALTTCLDETNPSLSCAAETMDWPVSQSDNAKVKLESWTMMGKNYLSPLNAGRLLCRNSGPSRRG